MARPRCGWAADPRFRDYHDREWGVASHDDRHLFEMLTLEGAQAGLSWATILAKREGYRRLFHGFEIERVARMSERDVARLLQDAAIVRHEGKIRTTIANARAALDVIEEHGSLDSFLWEFVGGRPKRNRWRSTAELPARTAESDAMSRELRRRGFSFVGSTICYAFLQATGMVDDHLTTCFRKRELAGDADPTRRSGPRQ